MNGIERSMDNLKRAYRQRMDAPTDREKRAANRLLMVQVESLLREYDEMARFDELAVRGGGANVTHTHRDVA